MTRTDLTVAADDQRNIRAEDGFQERTPWNSFCEGVLIPLGALFAVYVAMTSLMLFAR